MKKVKKPVFFLVFAVIAIFAITTLIGVSTQNGDITTTYVHGVKDIRLGIDIQGGVDVTFEPAGDVDATDEQMDAALEKIKTRLVSQGINDSDTYVDYKSDRIIVRFPWQAGETDFDPEQAVKELGETAELTFRYGTETTTNEDGETVPAGEIVLTGDDVKSAGTGATQDDTTKEATWMVTLDLNDSGKEKFYNATSALYQDNGKISIWMDNTMISAPSVNAVISDGKATISGNFTYESAKELADKINAGALPFALETTSFKTISPTMGEGALNAMVIAGLITCAFIVIYMIPLFRVMRSCQDNTATGAFHCYSKFCGRGRSKINVYYIPAHSHQCADYYVFYHFTRNAGITSHNNLITLCLAGSTNQSSISRGEFYNVKRVQSFSRSSADSSADSRDRFD